MSICIVTTLQEQLGHLNFVFCSNEATLAQVNTLTLMSCIRLTSLSNLVSCVHVNVVSEEKSVLSTVECDSELYSVSLNICNSFSNPLVLDFYSVR